MPTIDILDIQRNNTPFSDDAPEPEPPAFEIHDPHELCEIFKTYRTPVPKPDPTPASCGTDLMEWGADYVASTLRAYLGQPVVYQRGNRKIALCATFGRKLFKIDDGEGGIRMQWTDRDFLVAPADLVINAVQTLPERGDTIRQKVGTTTEVFEVLAPGGETPWQWCDPYRRMIRIHAKRIRTE